MTKLVEEIVVVKDWTNGEGYWATCKEAGAITFKIGTKKYEASYFVYPTGHREVDIKVDGGTRKVSFKQEKHNEIISEVFEVIEEMILERDKVEEVEETILETIEKNGEVIVKYYETMGSNFLNKESAGEFLRILETYDEIIEEYAYDVKERSYSVLIGGKLTDIWYDSPFGEWVAERGSKVLTKRVEDLETFLSYVRKEVLS